VMTVRSPNQRYTGRKVTPGWFALRLKTCNDWRHPRGLSDTPGIPTVGRQNDWRERRSRTYAKHDIDYVKRKIRHVVRGRSYCKNMTYI
jgi:hypothetical protein